MVNVYELDEIQEAVTPASNGHMGGGETLPRIDPARGVFITSLNEEIQLNNTYTSPLVFNYLRSHGKPAIPMIVTKLLGRHEQLEANPSDPNYIQALAEWTEVAADRVIRFIVTKKVVGKPDEAFAEEYRQYLPEASVDDLKIMWVLSKLAVSDIVVFMEAVIGQSLPTTPGLEDVANFTK